MKYPNGLKYVNDSETIQLVPPRDLTAEEAEMYGDKIMRIQKEIGRVLYEEPNPPKAKKSRKIEQSDEVEQTGGE